MSKTKRSLDSISIFSSLTPEDRSHLAALATEKSFDKDAVVYSEGEHGESLFIVAEGAVELQTMIGEGVEKPLLTVRENSVFGLVEVVEPQARAITAKAIQPTVLLEIGRPELAEFVKSNPETGMKVLFAISVGLARQMRVAMDVFRQNLAWTLDVSGAAALNLHQLITGSIQVSIDLANGQPLVGKLIKVESSEAGYELLVKTEDGAIHLVPYHAVVRLSFASADVDLPPEAPEVV